MKSTVLVLFLSVVSVAAYSQDKVRMDPTYSAYNYKHPNKAAYAKKHNFDNPAVADRIEVAHAENYKQPNSVTISKKVGVVTRFDKYKIYPNYKHQGR